MSKLTTKMIHEMQILRSQGKSISEISKVLYVPKTTVFRYVKTVKILSEFLEEWSIKRGGSRKKRIQKEEKAFEEGTRIVSKLANKEKLLFLAALYWAEGSKKDFGLSNTDPGIIQIFVYGLREVFGVRDSELRISIRIYEDLDMQKCLSFWSKVVNIPMEKFVGVNVLPGKKKGKLEYGMCRVRVMKAGDLLKKIKGINKAIIQEFVPVV